MPNALKITRMLFACISCLHLGPIPALMVTALHANAANHTTNPEVTMPALSTWNLDPTKLLTRRELATVLDDLARRANDSPNSHRNLVVVRLACCCGLRVSEMAALEFDDVVVDVSRTGDHERREIAVCAVVVGCRDAG
jgi:site-specific recombinase XerD